VIDDLAQRRLVDSGAALEELDRDAGCGVGVGAGCEVLGEVDEAEGALEWSGGVRRRRRLEDELVAVVATAFSFFFFFSLFVRLLGSLLVRLLVPACFSSYRSFLNPVSSNPLFSLSRISESGHSRTSLMDLSFR
jgi:hypothetical protein